MFLIETCLGKCVEASDIVGKESEKNVKGLQCFHLQHINSTESDIGLTPIWYDYSSLTSDPMAVANPGYRIS